MELTEEQKSIINKIEAEFKRRPGGIRFNNRPKKSTGTGRSAPFGFIRKRPWYAPGPSDENKKWPELWDLLKQYGSTIPVEWDAVQVNINCICGKHKDEGNIGDSYLISGGDYTGGELVVEGTRYNCRYNPLIFNGSEKEHWNEPFEGNKWTLVFFKTTIPRHFQHLYVDKWRQQYPNYKEEYIPGIAKSK
jgi:hypothetical protein